MSLFSGQLETSRLRAERNEARSEIATLKRMLDEADVSLKEKDRLVDALQKSVAQLRETVRIQSDMIKNSRDVNPNRGGTGINFGNQTLRAEHVKAPYVNTTPGVGVPAPLRTQAVESLRLSVGLPQEQQQTVVPANPHEQPAAGYPVVHRSSSRLFSLSNKQDSRPDPAPKYQHHNTTGSLAPVHQPSNTPNRSMLPLRSAAIQSLNWRTDALESAKQAAPSGKSSVVPLQSQDETCRWPKEFNNFFKLTEEWARSYASFVDMAEPVVLSENFQTVFSEDTNGENVLQLLSSGETRYLTVAKLVNARICSDLFQPEALEGYSRPFDSKMENFRTQLRPDLPVSVRHDLLRAIADTATELTSTDAFKEYVQERVLVQASALWDGVACLLSPGISEKQAFNGLRTVYQESYRIGVLMQCNPLGYSLVFPQAGPENLFNPSCMINRDLGFKDDPFSLARRGLRVRLGITPIIAVTNYIGDTEPQTVHFANVLLMR